MSDLVLERAVDNLIATYCAVGSQGDEAWIENWEGGLTCLSRLHHPVSNFAIVSEASPVKAQALARIAASRRAFNAYVLPGGTQEESEMALLKQGFLPSGRLQVMVGECGPSEDEEPLQIQSFEDRLSVCRFMARQFFSRHATHMRESIALATARASVRLYCNSLNPMVCAAMVSESTGAWGIYNLCVSVPDRNRGWGSLLLRQLMRSAASENRMITLQCDPSLEPWYSRRGFQGVGVVSVMTLDSKASHAIM